MQPFPPLHDAEAMAVFADMLSVRGDPRGELTHLQLALEQQPGHPKLVRAEQQHLALHDRRLLGSLRTSTSLFQFVWRRGFIVEARLKSLAGLATGWIFTRGRVRPGVSAAPARARLPRLVRELLSLESALTLQLLTIALPRSPFALQQLLGCAEAVFGSGHALPMVGLSYLEPGDAWGRSAEVSLQPDELELRGLHLSVTPELAQPLRQRFG